MLNKCFECDGTERVYHWSDEDKYICVDCMSWHELNVCDKCHFVTQTCELYWNDDAETKRERRPFKGGKYDALCVECIMESDRELVEVW